MRYLAIINAKGQIELIRSEFQLDNKNPHRRVAVFESIQEMLAYYDKYLGGGIDYSEYDACTCFLHNTLPHACPFACEINDNCDSEYCNCCPSCEHDCAMDI